VVAFFSRKGYLPFEVPPKVYFSVKGLVQPLCQQRRLKNQSMGLTISLSGEKVSFRDLPHSKFILPKQPISLCKTLSMLDLQVCN